MFGMGFTEILLIAVIAILFLGPDKLPGAMVDVAKFFRNAKNAISSVKDTLEEEINVSEIKREAEAYKAQLADMTAQLDVKSQAEAQLTDIKDSLSLEDDYEEAKPVNTTSQEPQEVTFKKKKKKKKESDIKDSDTEVEDV